jgi:hypothetical protein
LGGCKAVPSRRAVPCLVLVRADRRWGRIPRSSGCSGAAQFRQAGLDDRDVVLDLRNRSADIVGTAHDGPEARDQFSPMRQHVVERFTVGVAYVDGDYAL